MKQLIALLFCVLYAPYILQVKVYLLVTGSITCILPFATHVGVCVVV